MAIGATVALTAAISLGTFGMNVASAATGLWTRVSAGDVSTCAIQTDHTLWCWGAGLDGELGNGNPGPTPGTSSDVPVQAGTRANWSQVSVGYQGACAIRIDQSLWCWGDNSHGQLGQDNLMSQSDAPLRVGKAAWLQVSAGGGSVCGIQADHTLWCWGYNGGAQLGLGTRTLRQPKPVQVGTAADWVQVTMSGFACAVRTDGTLWCWGPNSYGNLGTGTTGGQEKMPAQVGTATDWTQVSVGYLEACATRADGTLWCWGRTFTGPDQPSPVQVGDATDWDQVSAGGSACALRGDPRLWCWGSNSLGQLGIGTTGGFYASPVQVGSRAYWRQVSSGNEGDACAVRGDDSLWCWGDNTWGQLGTGITGGTQDTPIEIS
jgi:alpha-tubulin suppressor-like RCC1 family protein